VEQHRRQSAFWIQPSSFQILPGVLQTPPGDERICGRPECRAILFQTLGKKLILGRPCSHRCAYKSSIAVSPSLSYRDCMSVSILCKLLFKCKVRTGSKNRVMFTVENTRTRMVFKQVRMYKRIETYPTGRKYRTGFRV